jgi:large conductance mechanosensitive channel
MQDMLNEFKAFLLRGNIIELAVAFVIGGAFSVVVNSLVDDLVMPVIAMLGGEPDFRFLDFTINDAIFRYGSFITNVVSFVIIAAAIFFLVVKPVNMTSERRKRGEEPAEETPEEIQLLREIRDALRSRA